MSQSNRSDRIAPVEDTHAKRAALAGQWRTPPHPIFPAGHPHAVAAAAAAAAAMNQPPPRGGHAPPTPHPSVHSIDATTAPMQQSHPGIPPTHSHTQPHPPPPHATHYSTHAPGGGLQAHTHASIPDNSEDYAKALQEAYRKGAEAAALMAQQQQHQQAHAPQQPPPPQQQPMTTAASCPNFQQIAPPPPHASGGLSAEEAAYSHQVHPTPGTTAHSSGRPDPLSSSMPPPPPQHGGHPQPPASGHPQHPPPPPHSQHMPPPHHSGYAPHHHPHPPPTSAAAAAAGTAKPPPPTSTTVAPPPPKTAAAAAVVHQSRSLSLPDMSAYAAQAEDEKRQKRLARNRASARLRRLRKKNLVDAYETEVGILEKTLKQLQAHEWGEADNHTALLDALGMERGQQAIAPEQRTEIIQDILKQQMQHVELLRQAQMEQECLSLLVDDPDDELSKELQSILQLTDTQKSNIKTSSKGLDSEVEALETVASSLEAMLENKWLLNEGVQNITDQLTSILHKNQLSKFLLWTDANVESIDQLDHVQVQPLQGAPIFSFGVESTPGDDEEK